MTTMEVFGSQHGSDLVVCERSPPELRLNKSGYTGLGPGHHEELVQTGGCGSRPGEASAARGSGPRRLSHPAASGGLPCSRTRPAHRTGDGGTAVVEQSVAAS